MIQPTVCCSFLFAVLMKSATTNAPINRAIMPNPRSMGWINAEIVRALSKPEVKEQLFKQGIEAQIATPAEYTKFVRAEVAKMGKIIKASGAKPEQ